MTPDWRAQRRKFFTDYYGFLIGATCTGFKLRDDEEGGDPWPVLTFEKVADANIEIDGQRTAEGEKLTFEVEVSQDEEGNGAGFLFGLPGPA